MQVIAHNTGLKEQRQLHDNEIVSLRKVCEDLLVHPLVDLWVGDFVQLHSLLRVVKDYFGQGSSVEFAGLCEDSRTEHLLDLLPRLFAWFHDCSERKC